MLSKIKGLEEKLKALREIGAYGTIDMGDLYLFPNLVILPKFKIPKFEKHDGMTSPILYLTMYTHSIAAHISNKKLIVYCFQHSLIGSALH